MRDPNQQRVEKRSTSARKKKPRLHSRALRLETLEGRDLLTTQLCTLFDSATLLEADAGIYADVPAQFSSIATDAGSAPVISGVGGNVAYEENAVPTVIAPLATVTDADSADFDGGTLTVTITSIAQADDQLAIEKQGTGTGEIDVSGNDVSFSGTPIGTFTGGTGTTPLFVSLNSSATPDAVQSLIRALTFATAGEAPVTATRTVSLELNDGDGSISDPATTSIDVIAVNDAPHLRHIGGKVKYAADSEPIVLAPLAKLSDADSPNFENGVLSVNVVGTKSGSNHLALGKGFRMDLTHNVFYGRVYIGTLVSSGQGIQPFRLKFNANATPAIVRKLVRTITFSTVGGEVGTRRIRFQLSDGDGAKSIARIMKVRVTR